MSINNKPLAPPSWVSRIGGYVKTRLFGPEGTVPVAVVRDVDTFESKAGYPYAAPMDIAQLWRVEMERRSTIVDINRMDADDELVSTSLDVFADCSVGYAEPSGNEPRANLTVKAKTNEAQVILNALIRRLDLQNELWQIARDSVKYAENYREVVLNPSRTNVIALKQTICYEIKPNTNAVGDKISGWVYRTNRTMSLVNPNDPGKLLEEWQICPFVFGNRMGTTYVPILASARRNWNRLQKIEDGMAIARLTRAYDKLVHMVPVKSTDTAAQIEQKLRNYKNNMGKKRIMGSDNQLTSQDSPFDVETDFFLPVDDSQRGGINVITQSNSQLGNLNDVYYLRERLFARLGVPIGYLQIMSTQKTHLRSGGMLSSVDVAFARRLRLLQASLRRGLQRLFDFELLLNGVVPVPDLYEIELTAITTNDALNDAKVALTNAQAAVYFVEAFGALPLDLLAERYLDLNMAQQEVWDTFMKKYQTRLEAAKVKAVELEATPPPTLGGKDRITGANTGSGNNNKSLAARSSEQKGAKQSISTNDAADLALKVQQALLDALQEQDIDLSNFEPQSLADITEDLRILVEGDEIN